MINNITLQNSTGDTIVAVFLTALIIMILYFGFRMFEMAYVMRTKRPL